MVFTVARLSILIVFLVLPALSLSAVVCSSVHHFSRDLQIPNLGRGPPPASITVHWLGFRKLSWELMLGVVCQPHTRSVAGAWLIVTVTAIQWTGPE